MSINEFTPAKKVDAIARVAHNANIAYSDAVDDKFPHKSWEESPESLRQTTRQGVLTRLENPDMSPAQMHANWMDAKIKDGYRYGEAKDDDAKTHPCLVPYDQLPKAQQTKDRLFSAIVDALK